MAYFLILSGLWLIFEWSLFNGLWLAFIGWFLLTGAQAANAQVMLETLLKGVTVEQCMETRVATTSPTISLQQVIAEVLLRQGRRSVFVVQGNNELVGLVTLKEIHPIPQQLWATTPVNQVMTPVGRLAVVTPQQDLRKILSLLVKRNVNQLPVVQDGYLIIAVSREHLLRFLEIHRTLNLEMDGENEVSLSSRER